MKDYKKVLFPYAYNILGTVDDALDAIQEVMTNYYTVKRERIENEKSYLIKGVINQAINIKSKRSRLKLGEIWLPEPVATDNADKAVELKEMASYSMLVLLEQLNPKERTVFILKEAFDYSHEEISEFLSVSTENSRKLLSRAKSKLKPDRISQDRKPSCISEKLTEYVSAIRLGNVLKLKKLLSHDVALYADGGPNLNIAARSLKGVAAVSDLLLFVYETYQKGFSIITAAVNHEPALLYYSGERLVSCQVFEFSPEGDVVQINIVIDPEKLKNIERKKW
ncbi:sigma-70 family RNA polymerase sigma factor [Rubrolithibacter danxiaensis]|uniref:sigma-70 family RNA polymerase sigma factor n=1 Tax=Rubrolithibacter danxiaensis TaxID=3390805 RepID=UPI003BF8C87B